MIITILLVCLYVYFGDKANEFCKRHILHLETIYVFDISSWLTNRAIWGFLLGWLTIPIAVILWLFGARNY